MDAAAAGTKAAKELPGRRADIPLSGQPLKNTCYRRLRLHSMAGELEVQVLYGQDALTRTWLCPVRRAWGLAAHQSMTPVLEEKLCFTAKLAGFV